MQFQCIAYAHLSVDNTCYLTTPDLFSQGVTFIKYYSDWQQWCPNSRRPGDGSRESVWQGRRKAAHQRVVKHTAPKAVFTSDTYQF